MIRIKNILCFLLLNVSLIMYGIGSPHKSKTPNATRLSFGTAFGFYLVNTHHAKFAYQNPGLNLGIRREMKVDRSSKVFFAFGIEYFMHGLNYYSYYFRPDTIKIYDKSLMTYKYSLFIHELAIPLQLKILFKRADNSLFSPYVSIGYHLRYLLTSNLSVFKNGELVRKDSPELTFKNPLFTNKINTFVSASIGWQKNNLASSKKSFFVELNYKYGFSQYSFQRDYSASSMYINGSHLCFLLGVKF